jgi:hypothetical protein
VRISLECGRELRGMEMRSNTIILILTMTICRRDDHSVASVGVRMKTKAVSTRMIMK